MEAEIKNPDAEKRGRGRPAGTGKGFTASERAKISRRKNKLEGKKRLDLMIGGEARLALFTLQRRQPDATITEIVEAALIEAEKRNRMR